MMFSALATLPESRRFSDEFLSDDAGRIKVAREQSLPCLGFCPSIFASSQVAAPLPRYSHEIPNKGACSQARNIVEKLCLFYAGNRTGTTGVTVICVSP